MNDLQRRLFLSDGHDYTKEATPHVIEGNTIADKGSSLFRINTAVYQTQTFILHGIVIPDAISKCTIELQIEDKLYITPTTGSLFSKGFHFPFAPLLIEPETPAAIRIRGPIKSWHVYCTGVLYRDLQ